MIQAKDFVDCARQFGFHWYTGVPCSFLTPFINYVIGDEDLNYLSAPNEGDAVAFGAGAALGGKRAVVMLQNSGLGNAVSPLSSLNWTFRLPILLIVTWRGEPGLKDEPQHELMGQITAETLDLLQIPWEYFPDQPEAIEPALQRANDYMQEHGRPYALIMKKGSVDTEKLAGRKTVSRRFNPPVEQVGASVPQELPGRREVLEKLVADAAPEADRTVFLATTGFTGRELFAAGDRDNQLYMVGSMGCVSALALGLACVRPDLRVVALDGDGAGLMRMGNFAYVGAYAGGNLFHVLLDNGVHDSTGSQETLSSAVRFTDIASACGYARVTEVADLQQLELFAMPVEGPTFIYIPTRPGTAPDLPRPDVTPSQVRQRLMQLIGA